MLGNFAYCNPTKLYFGEDSLQYLNTELPKYGENVVLVYGVYIYNEILWKRKDIFLLLSVIGMEIALF